MMITLKRNILGKLKAIFFSILFIIVLFIVTMFFVKINAANIKNNTTKKNQTYKFDFGLEKSDDYIHVDSTTSYNHDNGYGFNTPWNIEDVYANGSGPLSDAVSFKVNHNNTFNVDLEKGYYKITVALGNTECTSIIAENMIQLVNLTSDNVSESFIIPVTDGQLNIMAAPGKKNKAYTLSTLEISKVSEKDYNKTTIWLCGDSTVCNYYPKDTSTRVGFGQLLDEYINTDIYTIRNMASSGQTARGFVECGQFEPIEYYGKKGDYFIIAIGINDKKHSSEEEYYEIISNMVERSKAKEMIPILVKQQGSRLDVNKEQRPESKWFGNILDKIGKEQDIQVIDLFNKSLDEFIASSKDEAKNLFVDDLHPNREGARILSKIVSENIDFKANKDNSIKLSSKPSTPFIKDGVYYIQNELSKLYMDVENNSTENRANIRQWSFNGTDAQKFKVSFLDDGHCYIFTGSSNYNSCLDIENGSQDNGANLIQFSLLGGNMQRFKLEQNNDGSYIIYSEVSDLTKAIEVYSNSLAPLANINQWQYNNGENQHWRFIPAS